MLMRSADDFDAAPIRRLDSAGCHLLDTPAQASFTKTPLSDRTLSVLSVLIGYLYCVLRSHFTQNGTRSRTTRLTSNMKNDYSIPYFIACGARDQERWSKTLLNLYFY